MKAQRRHELQTNELADWLGQQIQRLRPYTQYIVVGVLALAAVTAIVTYQSARHEAHQAAAWQAYLTALNQRRPEALKDVAARYPDNPAALWALQAAGDILLEEGTALVYSDRQSAHDILEQARENFQIVANQAGENQQMLRRRAQYALGATYESLGQLDKAEEQYALVAQEAPDTAIGKLAAEGLQRLKDESTKQFYQLLAQYKPPSTLDDSGDEDPLAEFPDLPDRPDLSFPEEEMKLEGPASTSESPDASTKPASEASDQPAPKDTSDAAKQPADKKQHAPATPSQTPPAAAKPAGSPGTDARSDDPSQ